MIMSLEERRIKFQPRTKWNQNIYIVVKKGLLNNFSLKIAGLKELQIQISIRSKRPSLN